MSHVSVPGMRSTDVPSSDEVRPARMVSTLRNLAFGLVGLHGEEPSNGKSLEEIRSQLMHHR